MLRPDFGPAPFRGLIGPRRKLDETEVLASCGAFYRTIFDQKDGNAALKAMNDAVTTTEETFWTMSAELAFKVAFQDYMLRGDGSPQGAAARAEAFATRRAAKLATQRGVQIPDAEAIEVDVRASPNNLRNKYSPNEIHCAVFATASARSSASQRSFAGQ